ncbi:MAG: hypothetical protein MUC50_08780 [Myxococcota bacterium]|jgi:hypothetical protein|nr:hypothetical protein [Myxococcota bacterium]
MTKTHRQKSPPLPALLIVILFDPWGCSNGSKTADTVSETTETATVDTMSDTESLTEEDETPPELPSLCSLVLEGTSASEPVGRANSTKGDARWPTLAMSGEEGFFVMGYKDGEEPRDWDVRIAPYDCAVHGTPLPAPLSPSEPLAKGTSSRFPAAVATAEGYTVVFEDTRWDHDCDAKDLANCRSDLGMIALDPTGEPVAGDDPVRLTADSAVATRPSIAATSTGTLVAWLEAAQDGAGNALVLPVDSKGNPGSALSLTPKEDADGESRVQLASSKEQALVVFGLADPERIGAVLLSANGTAPGDLLVLDEGGSCRNPAVVATQDGYLVLWRRQITNDYEIFARSVSQTGELRPIERISYTTTDVRAPFVAWNGTSALGVWTSDRLSGAKACLQTSCAPQVLAAVLQPSGALASTEIAVSNDVNEQTSPTAAWDGSGWLIAWEGRRNLRQEVFYARIDCDQ